MTQLLYQLDSYLQVFDAKVVQTVEENKAIILDKTGFYPGGGGQPADKGMLIINGQAVSVAGIKKYGDQVLHFLDTPFLLPEVGTLVRGKIDWDWRYKLMRTHTALHILCGVVFRDYGASVTGGDMEPLNGRMDFEFETMHKDLVEIIERTVNFEVKKNRSIHVKILPREEAFNIPDLIRTKINLLPSNISEVRVVEIDGLDLQADGGTHVMNTEEVGVIRIIDYKSKGKINKRIYIELENR